jgi:hypothetical protein
MNKIEYKSKNYLEDLYTQLVTYIPNLLFDDIGFKRDNIIKIAVDKKFLYDNIHIDVYDLQMSGCRVIQLIYDSHLLGHNEIVIPHLIDEYKQLKLILKDINEKNKLLLKFEELKTLIPKYELNEINKCLYDDLLQLIETYDITDIDIKLLVKGI